MLWQDLVTFLSGGVFTTPSFAENNILDKINTTYPPNVGPNSKGNADSGQRTLYSENEIGNFSSKLKITGSETVAHSQNSDTDAKADDSNKGQNREDAESQQSV